MDVVVMATGVSYEAGGSVEGFDAPDAVMGIGYQGTSLDGETSVSSGVHFVVPMAALTWGTWVTAARDAIVADAATHDWTVKRLILPTLTMTVVSV